MKRIISLLLAILTVCTLTFGMSGCGGASKSAVVGVWKVVDEETVQHTIYHTLSDGKSVTSETIDYYRNEHLYVYEDGTSSILYANSPTYDGDKRFNGSYEWEIKGEYFEQRYEYGLFGKYKIDGDTMYDREGNAVYTKISNDTNLYIKNEYSYLVEDN